MNYVNINSSQYREALREEMPGLDYLIDDRTDMTELRFTFTVRHGMEYAVNDAQAREQVKVLAERMRQDVLVKTGANRRIRAAEDQAEQYRLENLRMAQMIAERDARIKTLNDQISEYLTDVAEEGPTNDPSLLSRLRDEIRGAIDSLDDHVTQGDMARVLQQLWQMVNS